MKAFNSLIAIIIVSTQAVIGQSITYTSHTEIIANPERGLYHHTETHSGDYSQLSATTLTNYRTEEQITQILRVFYLEKFRETPISSEYLSNMRSDFAAIRAAGIKCIVRFAYTTSSTAPYNDATPEVVQMHIDQLSSIFKENADVIEVVQAGFVGAWGEWYYTDHFANSPGQVDDEDWENRRQLVFSLLDALPSDRMVQIRTPGYKMTIFDSQEALSAQNAFVDQYSSRIGHHNDCFVASSSDYGTYVNPDIEKPYLAKETLYTPMGGETCNLASPYSDCDNSLSELERFHWSYLNIDYNTQVLNEWKNQGCFNEVETRLGYRYELVSGDFSTVSKPEGTFSFNLNVQNVGFANPYNPKDLRIILKNQETADEYFYSIEEDIRLWTLGEIQSLNLEMGLPANVVEGNYSLYLQITDTYQSLTNNPAYSIQMANESVWDSELGYNLLLSDINISPTNDVTDYMGSQYFIGSNSTETLTIPGADIIYGGGGINDIAVYWGRQPEAYQRIIERNDGNGYEIIASIPGNQDYFIDTNVEANTTYTYRYQLSNGGAQSNYSDEITISNTDSHPVINADGNSSDWLSIPPLVTAISNENPITLSAYFDSQNLNLLLNGTITQYAIYLDTDNNIETGNNESDLFVGFDYALIDGSLYEFTESIWSKVDADISFGNGESMELNFDYDLLSNLNDNQTIPTYVQINNEIILTNRDSKPTLYRTLPASLPENFQVVKSTNLPETRLVVSWSRCENCTGYELVRSEDDVNFEFLLEVDATTTLIRDENLTNQTTYYYKIAAINEIGKSDYSESISESTGLILSTNLEETLIYPNPTSNTIHTNKTYKSINIYDLSGVLRKKQSDNNRIDISDLSKGMYLIQLIEDQNIIEVKVIKQ